MSSNAAHATLADRAGSVGTRTVCIAGIGVLAPIGRGLAEFDDALFQGKSAVRAHTLEVDGFDALQVAVASCDFDHGAVRSSSRLPLDRGTAMALTAATDAANDAGIDLAAVNSERIGVFWGSGMAGAASFDLTTQALYGEGRRMRPTTVLTVMPNAAVAELALQFGARGAALGYACACASSAVAIGEAMRAIRGGWIDVAIVGGHDAMLTPGLLTAWHGMRVMALPPPGAAATACRPFAADRAGFALGEGAAALILESEAHAQERGASSKLILAGYATNCDATHLTNPDATGQAKAMWAALRDAGLHPSKIGYVNAHGTATGAGDLAEAASIHAVFGATVPVSATKAIHGHLLGGGGAVELISTLRALARGLLPPTANLLVPDPAFHLDFVRGESRDRPDLRFALTNSFAFGGTNAVLVAGLLTH